MVLGCSSVFLSGMANADPSVVGWLMIPVRFKPFLPLPALLLAAFCLSSCTLHRKGGGGGGGNATVGFTLVADTVPANPSILSFKVSVTSVVLTPASGSPQTLTPAVPVVDLMRLESDTAFLGTLSGVPSGTYTVSVAFSNPEIVFLNDTTSTITSGSASCSIGSVCVFSPSASGTPAISSFTVTASSGSQLGVGMDFHLNSAITLSSGTLSVDFNPSSPSPAVLGAFTLPRSNANLGADQLDLIEDFTGTVSVNGNNVTVASLTRGTITAANGSNSFFDASPDGTICPVPATFSCVAGGQVASVDVYLKSDGTFSLKEYTPLLATPQDLVEGIVFFVDSTNQRFSMAVTDKTEAATNSLIGGLATGDLLTVSLAATPPLKPFLVDTKGFPVAVSFPSSYALFHGQAEVGAIHPGQVVAVHPTAFTARSGTGNASATTDTVTLRWSRLIANTIGAASNTQFNVTSLPTYFLLTPSSILPTEVFTGTPGASGVTTFDGIPPGGTVALSPPPVALRVLYFQNSSNSAAIPFMAAKVRQR